MSLGFHASYGAARGCVGARRLLLVSASVAALVAPAFGQTPASPEIPGPVPQSKLTVSALPEMIVVARRRAERLQKVPVAVTVLSGKQLEQRGITNTNDLAQAVPSLTIGGQQRSNSQFYLRGTSPGVISQGIHNATAVVSYYLEVPTQISGPGVYYDMSSVEVLKGPQGTLFGRNTTGGAVLFNPVRPTTDYEGYIQGREGNYNDHELEGAVNLPFVPGQLDVRVSGALARRDGFTEDVTTGEKLDDRNYDAYRVSVDLHPIEDVDNLLVVDGRLINQNGTSAIPIEFNPDAQLGNLPLPPPDNVPFTIGGAGKPSVFCLEGANAGYSFGALCPAGGLGGILAAGLKAGGFSFYPQALLNQIIANQQKLGVRQFASDADFLDQERALDVTNISTWEINPDLMLKNIVGYRFNRINEASDFAGTDLPIVRNLSTPGDFGEDGLEQVTEEFQAQGTAVNGHLQYTIGAYFENATPGGDTSSETYEFAPPPSFKVNPAGYQYLLNAAHTILTNRFDDDTTSIFAHGEYDLSNLLSGLKFAAGARYNWDSRNLTESKYNSTLTKCVQSACPLTASGSFTAPTWSTVLSEQFNPSWMAYLSANRGYKSGGANLPALEDAEGHPLYSTYEPEYVTSFEVGSKNDYHILGAPARTNVALFHENYENFQVTYGSFAQSQLVTVVRNVPRATIDGMEIEQGIQPIRNLTLGGYVSYVRAVFSSDYLLEGVNIKNRQLPYTPTFKFGASASYAIPLGDQKGALAFTATWSRQDHSLSEDVLDPLGYFKSYDIVNLRADWTNVYNKPIDLSLVVNNATDATYASGGYPIYGQIGFHSNIYGEPRMIFGQLTVHWGPNAHW